MYELLQDYTKSKCREQAKLYYMDTESFLGYIKTEAIYTDTTKDIETGFERSSPKGRTKN